MLLLLLQLLQLLLLLRPQPKKVAGPHHGHRVVGANCLAHRREPLLCHGPLVSPRPFSFV
jgi:hypothetical protein